MKYTQEILETMESQQLFRDRVASSKSISEVLDFYVPRGDRGYHGTTHYRNFHMVCSNIEADISLSHFDGGRKGNQANFSKVPPIEEVLALDSEHYKTSSTNLKKRLLKEGLLDLKCSICGITEWNSKPFPNVIDHINGNPRDNRLENLRIICRNCDGQLDTFCGKIKRSISTPPCVDCGTKDKTKGSVRCKACHYSKVGKRGYSKKPRPTKINWPCTCELTETLKTSTYTKMGKELGVSDNSVRTRIKTHPCDCG